MELIGHSLEVNLNFHELFRLMWVDAGAADQSALKQPSRANFYSSSNYTPFSQ